MSNLNKFLRSPAVQILAPLALGYAERQSSDVRRLAPLLDTGLAIAQGGQSTSHDALQNTIFATAAKGLLNAAQSNTKPIKTGAKPMNGNTDSVTSPPTAGSPTAGVRTSEFYLTIAGVVALLAAKFGFDVNANEVAALMAALVALYTASRTIIKQAAAKQPDTVVVHAPVVSTPAAPAPLMPTMVAPVIAVPPLPADVSVADDAAPAGTS